MLLAPCYFCSLERFRYSLHVMEEDLGFYVSLANPSPSFALFGHPAFMAVTWKLDWHREELGNNYEYIISSICELQ